MYLKVPFSRRQATLSMRCRTIRHQLKAYVTDQLSQAQRLRLAKHIAHCQSCYAELQRELATVYELKRHLPALGQPNATQLARIWQGVKAQTWQKPPRYTDLRPASALLTLTLTLMCAAFVFRGSAAVAAPLPPSPAIVRATLTPIFTETPDPLGNAMARPTASLTALYANAPSAAPAPSARKP